MANFEEQNTQPYDWENEGVYIIQNEDYVEGGQDGVSNRQAKELTKRTRNLHKRMSTAEGEIDTLQADVPVKVEAALRTAKDYTDAKDSVVRRDMATADTATLRSAKDYADTIVAALVDNSPEALNTLQELAVAMGNDPNFATTVMQQIGERAKTSDVNAALAGKFDKTGGVITGDIVMKWAVSLKADNGTNLFSYSWEEGYGDVTILSSRTGGHTLKMGSNGNITFDAHSLYHSGNFNPADKFGFASGDVHADTLVNGSGYCYSNGAPAHGTVVSFKGLAVEGMYGSFQLMCDNQNYNNADFFIRNNNQQGFTPWRKLYHTGNLTPATTAATGLMSAADKTKLDNMREGLLASYQIAAGGNIQQYSGPKVSTKTVDKSGDGHYIVYHNIGHTSYFINVVAYGNRDAVCHAMVISKGRNQVEIAITNMDGGFVNCGFDLVLTI